MKFVQNNKILEDSNAENAEESAEKTGTGSTLATAFISSRKAHRGGAILLLVLLLVLVFSALISAVSASLR